MMAECPYCHIQSDSVERRRQNTQYVDDESNFVTCCIPCYEEIQEYWAEMWADYWAGCL